MSDDDTTERQRAADRVSAYLDHLKAIADQIGDTTPENEAVIDRRFGSHLLTVADLRTMLEAIPPPDPEQAERQRAADRVAAFANRFAAVEGDTGDLLDEYNTGETLLLSDLRRLIKAAPVLPPKWSSLLAPTPPKAVYVVCDDNDHERTYALERVTAFLEAWESDHDLDRLRSGHESIDRQDLRAALAEVRIVYASLLEVNAEAFASARPGASVTQVALDL